MVSVVGLGVQADKSMAAARIQVLHGAVVIDFFLGLGEWVSPGYSRRMPPDGARCGMANGSSIRDPRHGGAGNGKQGQWPAARRKRMRHYGGNS